MDDGIAKKYDDDKPATHLLPIFPLTLASEVFAFGADKYGERNWENGLLESRMYGSLLRHIFSFWEGDETDPESGLPHLGHAMCCLMMLTHTHYAIGGHDDRPTSVDR